VKIEVNAMQVATVIEASKEVPTQLSLQFQLTPAKARVLEMAKRGLFFVTANTGKLYNDRVLEKMTDGRRGVVTIVCTSTFKSRINIGCLCAIHTYTKASSLSGDAIK
jgi:hypothetical protein